MLILDPNVFLSDEFWTFVSIETYSFPKLVLEDLLKKKVRLLENYLKP